MKVDFLLVDATGSLAEVFFQPPFDVASRRGVRILVDKEQDITPQAVIEDVEQ